MSQLANPDTPSEAPALQDKAWTHLLHLETQTTDLISQSPQALLECLSPNSAPPAAEEPDPLATAPTSVAPVTLQLQIPCPALPDAYDENETAFSDALHSETEELQSPLPDIQTLTSEPLPSSPTPPKVQQHSPAWACQMFQQYVMASSSSAHSLCLDVEIKTMDTQQNCGVTALLNSRATGLFLDLEFVKCHGLTTQLLPKPIPVYNIDGTPNEASAISSMVDLEGDEWKVAFQTNQGLYEPLVMFFGLTNSPATFQTMMNNIFWDLIVEGVVCVCLDNILIYTKMLEEHHQITCLILECLHQHQLYLKPEKCEFEQTQIEYLSLIISHGTVEMDLVKVAGVAEWPEPWNKKKDFLHYACLLFDLTGKDVTWSWGPQEQAAFDTLKHAMSSRPVLLFPDNNSPFCIEANSSNFATGAVLSQQSPEDKKWHLVAFYSKSLNAVEQSYKIHDKWMLAIIWSFEE
ncbi:hypothetical protein E4T56_gene16846 [Termitomyces sp. T112]|nr:hypothetical protein E4T56_gene16846 [Termitomyces sp. T112]